MSVKARCTGWSMVCPSIRNYAVSIPVELGDIEVTAAAEVTIYPDGGIDVDGGFRFEDEDGTELDEGSTMADLAGEQECSPKDVHERIIERLCDAATDAHADWRETNQSRERGEP